MRYTIQSTRVVHNKNGKTKWDVVTDQGTFQTWDHVIGNSAPGTVIDGYTEQKAWGARYPGKYDTLLKLVEGNQQAPTTPAAPASPAASKSSQYIAVEAVKACYAADPKGDLKLIYDEALKLAAVMEAVEKELSIPKWVKALKAANALKAFKDAGFGRADGERMWAAAGGITEIFVEMVKNAILEKNRPPESAEQPGDDLPF